MSAQNADDHDHDQDHGTARRADGLSQTTNQAVVIHGAGDVRVEDRAVPTPGVGEVRVAVELGGICGSDLSYYRKGAVGDFKVTAPMVLGHEIIGLTHEVGGSVKNVDAGARVVVDPSSPCQMCARCREGRSNVCERPRFLGSAATTPHTDGGFASFVIARNENLVAIPDSLASSSAVFAEPLAVTVHAIGRAGGVRGARILVVGAGPIGSILVAAARAMGADHIAATDIDASRLERATAVGADTTSMAGEQDPGTDFDIVFEASGAPSGIADAFGRVRRGGHLVLVGLPHAGPIGVPIALAVPREIGIMGSFRFNHTEFVTAVDLLAAGLDLSPLLTQTVDAIDAAEAFVAASAPEAMKVQLSFAPR